MSAEIGASYMPAATRLDLDSAERQVHAWLRANSASIVNAEQKFRVDRRAIAGAIAWEMLENVHDIGVRAVGAGKVHLWNPYPVSGNKEIDTAMAYSVPALRDTDTIAKQTEDRGFLPGKTDGQRKALLATPDGAITYIGGIMAAIADIAASHGFDDIRSDPVILANVYQGKDLKKWEEHLEARARGGDPESLHAASSRLGFAGGNPMDVWIGGHLAFLEEAVGPPDHLVTGR